MTIEIKIPSVGESVQEAILAEWFKQDGDFVEKDEPLFVIETDKVTLEIVAEADGILKILTPVGEMALIGATVGLIEPSESAEVEKPETPVTEPEKKTPTEAAQAPQVSEPIPEKPLLSDLKAQANIPLSPSVRRLIAEKNLDVTKISGSGPGGRITKGDALLYLEQIPAEAAAIISPPSESGTPDMAPSIEAEVRKPMTPIRKRIAARLLEARQNTAMLTTFNEIDMSRTMAIRSKFKEQFQKRHDVTLGFMSFFIKASVEALKEIPEINAFIDGSDIIYHNCQHIGVAIGTKRGLVVPVIRNAERLSFAGIEQAIVDLVARIKANRLELADLEGGTFTVSNGGVYGSLLSTPILNTPQSGILGMHKIEKS